MDTEYWFVGELKITEVQYVSLRTYENLEVRTMDASDFEKLLNKYRSGVQETRVQADSKPHWTQPIREDVRGLRGLELRTCFLNVPDEEQRAVVEDLVRDEARALNYKLFEIDCAEATEATFRGRWILELNKPGVRSIPEWWSEEPTRILIKGINGLTGDAIPAMATVVDCEFKREVPAIGCLSLS